MASDQPQKDSKRPAWDLFWPLRVLITLSFIAIVLLTLAQIFFRFVLDSPLIWSEELSRLLIVWVTFIGAAVVCWDGRHLNIDVGFALLPKLGKLVVRTFNALISVGLLILLVEPTLRLVEIENFSELGALELPSGIVRLPVAIGAVLMVAAILLRLTYRRRTAAPDDPTFAKDAM
ncbi:MAG: TRAP transporter small permease [Pseudomonadota bacterium]